MRSVRSEFGHAYGTYSFGYTLHAELDPGEDPKDAYAHGFLPSSSDPTRIGQFYMARSVRIPLASFALSSENRRIARKFEGAYETSILSREQLHTDAEFEELFLSYFAELHGPALMPKERLLGILATPLPLQAVRYAKDGVAAGYRLEIQGNGFSHYWYSCYRAEFAKSSFGMWLMLDFIQSAKAAGKEYAYIGTAYGDKGRYKTNFSPLEFWDGTVWNPDQTLLKRYIAEDANRSIPFSDRFAAP